jgi:hypothetical protein
MPVVMTKVMGALCFVALAGCPRTDGQGSDASGSETTEEPSGGDDHDHDLDHAFCDCMLVHCHDDFHEQWGESDLEATLNCRDEAAKLPRAGEPTLEGNVIECRLGHCEAAESEPEQCEAALGDPPCR